MSKIKLPKQIQNDPRIKAVFGEPKPQLEQTLKPTHKGGCGFGSWQQIRMAWIKKQPLRICKNPNCKKEFLPQTVGHRFCSRECYLSSRRKREAVPTSCSSCGRKSRVLVGGRCSFCHANHRKFMISEREERELSRNRCQRCGGIVKRNISPQMTKFRLCGKCFPIVFLRPKCPRCNHESGVTLSQQIASDANIILWFCHVDDYIFPQSIGK